MSDIKVLEEFAELIAQKVAEKIGGTTPATEQYFTMKQVCSMLSISASKLYKHKAEGLIVPAKYCGRKPLFDQQSIDDYLKAFEK